MFISIGPSCHPAGCLRLLGLRKHSLPIDWLLSSYTRVFEYINDLITTDFKDFTTDLIYNHREKVISKNYDYVEFFHYDLIKNKKMGRNEDDNKNLVEMMNTRALRFMDIISNKNNKVIFLCMIDHRYINNVKLYEDMVKFDTNNKIKCEYKILVYVFKPDEDYNLVLPTNFSNLKHFIFDKYILNSDVNKVYGDIKDFKLLLKKNNLI